MRDQLAGRRRNERNEGAHDEQPSPPHQTAGEGQGRGVSSRTRSPTGGGSSIYDSFTAVEAERKRLAAAGTDLWQPGSPDSRPRLVTWWRAFACQQLGEAFLDADYAADLHAGMPAQVSQNLHGRIERTIKRAIENAYRIGQLAAMPPAGIRRLPRPGEDGFDMWCLTDPRSRASWRNDPAAVRAIEMLWKLDPDPEATLGIQAQIDAAVERGDLSLTSGGHYFCCPWSAVYQVVNPVTIGGKRFRRGKRLTFDVSAEEMAEGGPFTRDILSGDFQPTDKVGYCNPEKGHDD